MIREYAIVIREYAIVIGAGLGIASILILVSLILGLYIRTLL